YQSKPIKPTEITGAGPGASTASPAAPGASGARAGGGAGVGAGGPGGPVGVEVAKVEVSRLQDDAQSVGSMRSRQNVMVRPEVAGRIMSLGFTDGGRVRKGDVIVQLDDVLQRAEVRQADAQVSISRANLKRNQDLVAQSFIAQRVVDESAANLLVVEAQLALACARLDRMRVTAPFDGTAGIRNINVGDYVKDGADLVNIEDLSSMYVDFKLPERFQGKLRKGQPVEMELDAMPGRKFKARIEAIDPNIDANGRSISVRAVMPNTAGESARPAGAGGAAAGSGSATKPMAAVRSGQRSTGRPEASGVAGPVSRPAAAGADAVAGACAPYTNSVLTARRQGAGGGLSADAVNPQANAAPGGTGGAGNGPLRPGMFARVTTVFNVNDASLTVPEEAIVPQGGRQFVIKVVEQTEEQFKALAEAAKKAAAAAAPVAGTSAAGGAPGAGGTAPAPQAPVFVNGVRLVSQRTEVKIGVRRPGRVEILEGVKDGDTVVVAGQQRLQRDASAVRIIELGRPGGARSGGGQGAQGPMPAAPGASAAQ
ncbi:MAG: efflux RND transporter periplasmic adaptor subunit, partial [Burkholderiaceae bacterium]